MTVLYGTDGELLNPAAALALIDDATIDALYDLFDPEAPMGWSIEHAGQNQERLTVTGWKLEETEDGYPWHTLHEAEISVQIPERYINVHDAGDGLGKTDVEVAIFGQRYG